MAASKALRTVQEPLDEAAWGAEVKDDAVLAQLVAVAGQPWQAAGVIQDSLAVRLVWAEFAAAPTAPRAEVATVFRVCDSAGKCVHGTAKHTETGVVLSDSSGQPMSAVSLGIPVLSKTLAAHSIENDTTILAPLQRSHVVDAAVVRNQFDLGGFQTRRLVLFNAYGPQVAATLDEIRQSGEKTGLFDKVLTIDFVRRTDIEAMLPLLTPLDVVVWVGAGVQEKFSNKPWKPVGLTVSRGVFGDDLFHFKLLDDLLAAPPLGGPGLVVLIGSNTASADYATDKSALAFKLYETPFRPVVGFEGSVSWAQAVHAGATLLGALGAGADLNSAMLEAGSGLPAALVSPMPEEKRQLWKLPGKTSAFWTSIPSHVDLTVHVHGPPLCVKPQPTCDAATFNTVAAKPSNRLPPEQSGKGWAQFLCEATFTGPWFKCTGSNVNTGADFTVRGVMLGRAVGDSLFLYIDGSAGVAYRNTAILGVGKIIGVDESGGTTALTFDGAAAAAPYQDDADQCCIIKSPLLQSYDDKPGLIKITH